MNDKLGARCRAALTHLQTDHVRQPESRQLIEDLSLALLSGDECRAQQALSHAEERHWMMHLEHAELGAVHPLDLYVAPSNHA